ncbi:MAG: acyl-CoA dehydrogenase family protein, partial [Nocardioides sp.]
MDFTLPPAAIDSAELTARLLTQLAGSADSGDLTEQEGSFDRELWRALGSAGLLGLQLPADHGGSDQGLLAWCSALAAAGRHTG